MTEARQDGDHSEHDESPSFGLILDVPKFNVRDDFKLGSVKLPSSTTQLLSSSSAEACLIAKRESRWLASTLEVLEDSSGACVPNLLIDRPSSRCDLLIIGSMSFSCLLFVQCDTIRTCSLSDSFVTLRPSHFIICINLVY